MPLLLIFEPCLSAHLCTSFISTSLTWKILLLYYLIGLIAKSKIGTSVYLIDVHIEPVDLVLGETVIYEDIGDMPSQPPSIILMSGEQLITENDDRRQITDITSDNEDITLDITVYNDGFSDYSIEKRSLTHQGVIDLILQSTTG